jgi:hypothetical protein
MSWLLWQCRKRQRRGKHCKGKAMENIERCSSDSWPLLGTIILLVVWEVT